MNEIKKVELLKLIDDDIKLIGNKKEVTPEVLNLFNDSKIACYNIEDVYKIVNDNVEIKYSEDEHEGKRILSAINILLNKSKNTSLSAGTYLKISEIFNNNIMAKQTTIGAWGVPTAHIYYHDYLLRSIFSFVALIELVAIKKDILCEKLQCVNSCKKLFDLGFFPSFDGLIWRLHSGQNFEVVYETRIEECVGLGYWRVEYFDKNKQDEYNKASRKAFRENDNFYLNILPTFGMDLVENNWKYGL